jgi:hypothetical protein
VLDRPAPQPERLAQRRQQHCERMRRHRRRERDGTLMITVAITPAQTAKLAALRYLGEGELESRGRIAEAIGAVLDAIEIG